MNAPENNAEANQSLQDIDTQTALRGSNRDEYEIYAACAEQLRWTVKSYEEWITS